MSQKITREQAVKNGLPRFFTGKPCVRGHIAARYTSNGTCVICNQLFYSEWTKRNSDEVNARNRAWMATNGENYRAKNKDRLRTHTYKWRLANKGKYKAKQQEWINANKDHIRKRDAVQYIANRPKELRMSKEWKRANPDKVKAHYHKWRSAQKSGNHTAADLRDIARRQGYRCAYCGVSVRKNKHIDHIIPLSLGGSNDRRNIQLLCKKCNLTKYSKHPMDYAREIGLLL